jgi:hypothetical protein
MKPIALTPEQEARIDEMIAEDAGASFSADDIAAELGIPPQSDRQWTDDEIDRIWAEYETGRRQWFTAQLLYPELDLSAALALLK